MDPFSLAGKVIVVTGGTGILGESFVNGIVEAGGAVGILGRKREVAEQRAEAVRQKGGKALALVADVMNEAQLEGARQQVLDEFGRIDGLVNGAGGNMPEATLAPDADVFQMSMDGLRRAVDLNLWGTVIPTQIFGAAMVASGGGSIVNITSMAAKKAITRVLGYSMAKAAIENYTQWFAVEMARRHGDAVRINAIAPGFFLTEQNRFLLTREEGGFTERGNMVIRQTPYGRFGEPDELKGALVWLLSDASRFVTGASIVVDGGFSIFSGV